MEGYWSEMPPYHHHQQLVAYEYMDVVRSRIVLQPGSG